ncbi:MAG: beta-ketoacyl-ACP synthase II [Alphaproteobacteria bacterium]|nr:beta-ketoacyl-ACP synthase II [Alphaproteobacteria bacterium]MBE8219941.1 beta-ketoacyl-ACP synthase II [Alphaproteobacteria bacterium]
MRRVVITGVGAITPLGASAEKSWSQVLAGASGASLVEDFDTSDLPCKIACSVDWGGDFKPDDFVAAKEQRRIDRFMILGIAAADMAIADSGFKAETEEQKNASGVLIGSGIGGLRGIEQTSITLHEKGPRKVSPFFIPGHLANLISGHVSINHQFRGPNHSVVTACSTGAHAIGDAARIIALGDADVMVAGGAESSVTRLAFAGFCAARAMSTNFNEDPARASRPYDKDRDGFVMGEGAGVVMLEDYDHAKARGAKIYAEIIGYGMSGDAYHITSPAEDGGGAYRAMKAACKRAELNTGDIQYVNAHGTSTPMGDEIELKAIERLFGADAAGLAMSSTKSSIGHLLGAAGSVEAIFSILALRDNIMPPTINLDNPSVETDINLIPHKAQERELTSVLSNSFGFGGTNASLIFTKV